MNRTLRQEDIKVEVEREKFYNAAPLITPDGSPMGLIGGLLSNGLGWHFDPVTTNNPWLTARPLWTAGAPDAFGNRRWSVSGNVVRKVWGWEGFGTNLEGVPGKYYTMECDVRTYITSMNGHPDYVAQPPARLNLYATNGNEAQDVLIAQSTVINPILPSNSSWPFHPGYREWRLALNSVAPMPVGKTFFRLELEYDNDFTINDEIYLPADYSYPTVPPNLNFFSVRRASMRPIEYSGANQEWYPLTNGVDFTYNWNDNRVHHNVAANKGIGADVTVTRDTLIPTNGIKIKLWFNWAEPNLTMQMITTKGTYNAASRNVGSGWQEWTFPASCFNDVDTQLVKLRINARGIQSPLIVADKSFDDFDGFFFYNYDDWTGNVAKVDINRYDTEVSTCSIAFRENEGDPELDVGPTFEQGKRIRVSAPGVFPGQTVHGEYGISHNTYNTLFVGEVQNRRATYPMKARKQVIVLATNKFPVLQEKTTWALASMEDYRKTIPSLGIPLAFDNGEIPASPRDPLVSLTGYGDVDDRWVIRDPTNGFPMFDALMLTRNSQFGYVYFDRWGRLNLRTDLGVLKHRFKDIPESDETSYASIDVHYDTENTINSIRIVEYQQVATINESTYQRDDAIVETEQTMYDLESMRRYRKSEIEFKTFKKSNYDELRMHVLDKYATPQVRATTLVVPVRDMATAEKAVHTDIYDLIAVEYQDRIDGQFRVNRIKHTLIPGETWRMELGFNVNNEGVYW